MSLTYAISASSCQALRTSCKYSIRREQWLIPDWRELKRRPDEMVTIQPPTAEHNRSVKALLHRIRRDQDTTEAEADSSIISPR